MKDKVDSLLIDGISFNRDWARSKTEEEFIAEGETNGWYAGAKNKVTKLKEAHKALLARKNAAVATEEK